MASQELVSSLHNLANDIENNRLTEDDVCDRIKTLSERVEELSTLTGFDSSGVVNILAQVFCLYAIDVVLGDLPLTYPQKL